MKQFVTRWVRRRNPHFSIHPAVGLSGVAGFGWRTTRALLRGQLLWLRGRNPHGALLGSGVAFEYLGSIRYGRWLKVGDQVRFSGLSTGGLTLGHHVSIGSFSQVIVSTSLQAPGQYIHIGNRVGIGEFAYLGGGGGLRIDDDCIIGQYFSCHPENHVHTDVHTVIRLQGTTQRGIHIGAGCWIGSKVTVLDGVSIGVGCVVAAGAVVTRSLPDYCVAAGVPARVISTRAVRPARLHPEPA